MPKPVIFCIDDDASVLGAVTRDLRARYGEDFHVLRAESGQAALEALTELKQRGEPVALFLVDQQMPQMNGVEFLGKAMQLYPGAKRVLLTAYADTASAIEAINAVAVHYYLLKPWDPPEEALYPVLDDLIEDWKASYQPPFSGIRLIGHRWSPESHQIKDFLAGNHVPYQYLDVELDPEARALLDQLGRQQAELPVLIYPDGSVVECPEISEVAARIGLQTQAERPFYDVSIVGGGPGGLAAAVYAASEGLRTVMVERQAPGGQAGTSARIENYLGFPSGLSGADLARRAVTQARRFGVEILNPQEVVGLAVDGPYRMITLADGSQISSHTVILAPGLEYRRLDIPGADRLLGRGLYYGASQTEAVYCREQTVFVVGAGNSAGQAAMYLSQYAEKVVILVRGESLGAKMSQYLVDRIQQTANIDVRLESEAVELGGLDHLETVTVRHCPSGKKETIPGVALYIFIGAIPCTGWLEGVLRLDNHGFILTGDQLRDINGHLPHEWPLRRSPFLFETSLPGVFTVGDARSGSIKRVASAVGEGSIAVQFIHQYLAKVK